MNTRPFLLGICLGFLVAAGCSENDLVMQRYDGHDQDADITLILQGDPIDTVYITSEDSVSENYSSSFTVRWSALGGTASMGYGLRCEWIGNERVVTKEVIADDNGSIDITITDCPAGHTWNVYYSNTTDLHLEETDSVSTNGYTYDISWRHTIHEPGKGYINFAEVPAEHMGATGRSLGIMYTREFIDTLRVAIDPITWHYAICETGSDLCVALSGNTNAYRLFIETYGDGFLGMSEIPLDSDGSFSKEFFLAFIYMGDSFLRHDSRLYVIGTVGMPKIIHLRNPLGASPDARLIP